MSSFRTNQSLEAKQIDKDHNTGFMNDRTLYQDILGIFFLSYHLYKTVLHQDDPLSYIPSRHESGKKSSALM